MSTDFQPHSGTIWTAVIYATSPAVTTSPSKPAPCASQPRRKHFRSAGLTAAPPRRAVIRPDSMDQWTKRVVPARALNAPGRSAGGHAGPRPMLAHVPLHLSTPPMGARRCRLTTNQRRRWQHVGASRGADRREGTRRWGGPLPAAGCHRPSRTEIYAAPCNSRPAGRSGAEPWSVSRGILGGELGRHVPTSWSRTISRRNPPPPFTVRGQRVPRQGTGNTCCEVSGNWGDEGMNGAFHSH